MRRSSVGQALLVLVASLECSHVVGEKDGAQTRNQLRRRDTGTSSAAVEGENDERQLYAREFEGGMEAIMTGQVEREQEAELRPKGVHDIQNPLVGQRVEVDKSKLDGILKEVDPDVSLRIVGGQASQGQRNFCMHLKYDIFDEEYQFAGCGGTLISSCHILTAAHCSADGRAGLPDAVYCNAFNPFEGNLGRNFHFSRLRRITTHPNFDNYSNVNDVAILEMENCVPNIAEFPVMEVADDAFMATLAAGQTAAVSGFGRLAEDTATVSAAPVQQLQQVALPYIPRSACSSFYPSRLTDDMLCAGRSSGGLDACQGDSGGPLYVPNPDGSDVGLVQIGVVSWGSGCARANRPGVYSSMAYHREWIQDHVCPDERIDPVSLCANRAQPTQSPTKQPTKSPTPRPTNNPTTSSSTPPPTDAPATCSYIGQACDVLPCCGRFQCISRIYGEPPYCEFSFLDDRPTLSLGSGGGSSFWNP